MWTTNFEVAVPKLALADAPSGENFQPVVNLCECRISQATDTSAYCSVSASGRTMKEQKCPNCDVTIYGDGMGFLSVEAEMALHLIAHNLFRTYV
jgi:hypothetical protein